MALMIHQVTPFSNFDRIIKVQGLTYGVIENKNIIQFGYNCEPKGLALKYPIYINFTNGTTPKNDTRFFIGKSGIYEASFNQETDDRLAVHSFALPLDVRFTCNYVTATTTAD